MQLQTAYVEPVEQEEMLQGSTAAFCFGRLSFNSPSLPLLDIHQPSKLLSIIIQPPSEQGCSFFSGVGFPGYGVGVRRYLRLPRFASLVRYNQSWPPLCPPRTCGEPARGHRPPIPAPGMPCAASGPSAERGCICPIAPWDDSTRMHRPLLEISRPNPCAGGQNALRTPNLQRPNSRTIFQPQRGALPRCLQAP